MQLTNLTLLLSMTLALTSTQKLTPNAVASLLQGILSPKNTEQAIQILSAAANKQRALPTVARRCALTDNIPRTARTEAQTKITHLIQNPKEMCMKKNVVVQNSNNVMVQRGKQMVLPQNMVVQQRGQQGIPKNVIVQRRPEMVLPKNVMIQNGKVAMPRNVIVRKEMPKMLVQNNDFTSALQMRPEVQQKVLISQPQMTEYLTVPQQKVLVRNENPFLPAASPISALTASSALPPALPKSRGQFLRKIPIPPPTL